MFPNNPPDRVRSSTAAATESRDSVDPELTAAKAIIASIMRLIPSESRDDVVQWFVDSYAAGDVEPERFGVTS